MEIENEIFIAALKNIVQKQKQMKQLEIAGETCIAQSTISGYIYNRTKPSFEYKKAILKAFERVLNYKSDEVIKNGKFYLENYDSSGLKISTLNVKNVIDEHQETIKKFKTPEKGLSANQALLKIEKLDERLFWRTVADLEYMAKKLEQGIKPEPLLLDSNTISTKRQKASNFKKKNDLQKKIAKKEKT